ncbi:peptide deformylase [Tumidithrix helvetica PCC 7403]|uniref:peptide deformylase n=1 Tax=Tumidithrix helvetica TaxID=3457545 RepID=UPI003CAA160D
MDMDICQLGNIGLRQIAQPVENVRDRAVQDLIDRLIETLKAKKGVGIAAPQVGQSLRLIIVASHPNDRYPQAPLMAPTAMIDPRIVSHSEQVEKGWEGCLSVPGIRGLVPRYQAIEVEYCDRDGNLETTTFTDFVARIFQHEYDHLEGKVFLDRVESSLELISESEYLKLVAAK